MSEEMKYTQLRNLCGRLEDGSVMAETVDLMWVRQLLEPAVDESETTITQLRAALEDKVAASDDYEAVDLGSLKRRLVCLRTDELHTEADCIESVIAELCDHRRLAALNRPRRVVECQECKRDYLPRDGCVWCKAVQLEADATDLAECMVEISNGLGSRIAPDETDDEAVSRLETIGVIIRGKADLIAKHTPGAKEAE